MVIEGMGFGTGPIRPKGTEAPKRAGSQVDRAEAPESVAQTGDRVEISHRPVHEAEGVDVKAERRDGELLDDARVSEIRERIASGFYETDEVLKAILSGLELDEPTLFS